MIRRKGPLQLAQTLVLKTKELLKATGWHQGAYGDVHGAHCILGAMNAVVNEGMDEVMDEVEHRPRTADSQCLLLARSFAHDAILASIPARHRKDDGIVSYNDSPQTTKSSVLRTLGRAIHQLDVEIQEAPE